MGIHQLGVVAEETIWQLMLVCYCYIWTKLVYIICFIYFKFGARDYLLISLFHYPNNVLYLDETHFQEIKTVYVIIIIFI